MNRKCMEDIGRQLKYKEAYYNAQCKFEVQGIVTLPPDIRVQICDCSVLCEYLSVAEINKGLTFCRCKFPVQLGLSWIQ
jgi:hypothetical protein